MNRKYPGPLLECDEGDDVEASAAFEAKASLPDKGKWKTRDISINEATWTDLANLDPIKGHLDSSCFSQSFFCNLIK